MRFRSLWISLCLAGLLWAGPEHGRQALADGLAFLASTQNPNGSFGVIPGAEEAGDVGITGLVLKAFADAPEDLRAPYALAIEKALDYLQAAAREDGAIGDPMQGLGNYRTSMGILALSALDAEKYSDLIAGARDWLMANQFHEGNLDVGRDSPHFGGFGYDKTSSKPDADMSNTQYALEALIAAGVPKDSEVFQRALVFLQRSHDSEANDLPGIKVEGSGGFFYDPALSRNKSTVTEHEDGTVSVAPYASMTYAGLKSMIYAGLDKEDPRVVAAIDWIRAHYTLEENYGLGTRDDPAGSQQGLYYYYGTFARALEAYGERVIVGDDGEEHVWAEDLIAKLVSVQKPEKFWQNENSRWWEQDPVLVTAYACQALGVALAHLD